MGRFRGLPAVLAMLLGGAALALAAGAVAYAVRKRGSARLDDGSVEDLEEGWGQPSEDSPDTAMPKEAGGLEAPPALGDQVSAELAETEAASEAALEFQALEADEPAGLEETARDAVLPRSGEAPVLPARRAERTLPQSARWTLMAAAVLVGALVGLMLFLLTGGTIGR